MASQLTTAEISAVTAVTNSVAVQCEECNCEDERINSPEASTLSPASSSASSCSTCSSAPSGDQRKNMNFLKRNTLMKRETIVEEPEDDSDYNDCDNSSSPAIISV